MNTIELRSVTRTYGRTFALHRVSMSLKAGTMTALLGDNGAGKTTLLNILATLDAPDEGDVIYDRQTWKRFARRGREQIGWVSHDSLVYPELTGRENLVFYARMYGLDGVDRLVEGWLERVGLVDAADRRVDTYSRGMRQRLTVARALLHNPPLVLLDEPMTGLDQQGTRTMADLFCELRDEGRLVIIITHDLHVLEGRVDALGILKRGKLAFHGPAKTAAEIWHAYETYA